jgi:Na+-driven multidrug efflux pump
MCLGGCDLRYRWTWRCVSGRWVVERFTHVEEVVLAASGYFCVTGFAYGFMAVSVMLFPLIRDGGKATVPLLTSLLRVAVVLLGGWVILQWSDPQLYWLYYLVAISVILSASTLAIIFAFRHPGATRKVLSG